MQEEDVDQLPIEDGTDKKICGWIICKLKKQYDISNELRSNSNGESMLNKICQLSYGVITEEELPPRSNWVFLANDQSLQSVAKFSPTEISAASQNSITLELCRIKDESYKSKQKEEESYFRGYIVKDSPVKDLNGKYMEAGMFCGAPVFRHVREWLILRCRLSEIEELGITKEDAKLLDDQFASAEKYFLKAEKAFLEISTASAESIKDGSAEFTRRFVDIARAGNKLITADQTIYNLHHNNRRAEFISRASLNLLRQIAGARHSFSPTHVHNENSSSSRPQTNSPAITKSDRPLSSNQIGGSLDEVTVDNVELQLIFTKQITYQGKNVGSQVLEGIEQWTVESELASEVLAQIEKRESQLEKLRDYVNAMEKIYLEEGYEAVRGEGINLLEGILHELRVSTIEFSEVYGRWARLYSLSNRKKKRLALQVWDEHSYRKNYCVIVGYYGVSDLYGSSQEVKSSSKKYHRPFELPKKSTEMKYVGEYFTEDEAFRAFHEAIKKIPLEQLHPDDQATNCKPITSFRPCLRHYLVRTSLVPQTTPCEQCAINHQLQQYNSAAVLYEGSPFPCFLYKQYNYNQKIWNDCNFLSNYGIIRKHYSSDLITFEENPFLIPHVTKESINSISRSTPNRNEGNSTLLKWQFDRKNDVDDPLNNLKNRSEQFQDALQASKEYYKQLKKKQLAQQYKNSPYNMTPLRSFLPKIGTEMGKSKNLPRSTSAILARSTPSLSQSQSSPSGLTWIPSTATAEEDQLKDVFVFGKDLESVSMPRLKTAWKILTQNYQVAEPQNMEENLGEKFEERNFKNPADIVDISSRKMKREKLPEPDLSRTIDVDATYSDRAADITVKQKRFPPIYRHDEIFARTDIGEFAGLTKGRAVRAFDFKEHLYRSGKEREEMRKDLQQRLRAAIAVHVVHCDVAHLTALIDEARTVRGSVLQLDIIQAENFIQQYFFTVTCFLRLQSIYRGNRARQIFRKLKKQKKHRLLHSKLTEIQAVTFAKDLVPVWIDQAYKRVWKRRCKPVFSCVANLSGFHCQISIFEGARTFRSPILANETCLFCQSQSFSDILFPNNCDLTRHERMPCVCSIMRCSEKWFVRYYFPTVSKIIVKSFSIQEVRTLLLDYEEVKRKFLDLRHLRSIFLSSDEGTLPSMISYDSIKPLFNSALLEGCDNAAPDNSKCGFKNECTYAPGTFHGTSTANQKNNLLPGKNNGSYSLAWFAVTRESAVLPRLQQPLPVDISQVLYSLRGKLVTPHLVSTEGPRTVLDYDSIICRDDNAVFPYSSSDKDEIADAILQSKWNWEPIYDLQQINLIRCDLLRAMEDAQARQLQSQNQYQQQLIVAEVNRSEMENAMMKREDQWSVIYSLQWKYEALLRKNQEIMNFSKKLHQYVSELESRQRTDEARSYDGLEDGFQWKDMNQVLKIQKLLLEQALLVTPLESLSNEAQRVLQKTIQELQQCQKVYDKAVQDYEEHSRLQQIMEINYTKELLNLKRTMKAFASLFSYRRKLIPTLDHHLTIYPYHLVFLRNPFERLKKENRKVMTGLVRKAMILSPSNPAMFDKYLTVPADCIQSGDHFLHDKEDHQLSKQLFRPQSSLQRYLVSVFVDELTGSVIINLSGGDSRMLKTEEGCQHEDLYLDASTFSSITQYIQPGDIVLTSEDIILLLKRSPNFYQNYSFFPARIQQDTTSLTGSSKKKSLEKEIFRLPSENTRSFGNYFCMDSDLIRTKRRDEKVKVHPIMRLMEKLYQESLVAEDMRIEVEGDPISNPAQTDSTRSSTASTTRKTLMRGSYRTFFQRFCHEERKKGYFAERLLAYLKVQPHTHRPCFGLLHFLRRRDYSQRNWKNSAWISDTLALNPLHLTNLPIEEVITFTVANYRVQLQIFEHLQRFEIVLRSMVQDQATQIVSRIEVHVNELFHSFLNLNPLSNTPDSCGGNVCVAFQYVGFMHRIITGNYLNLSSNIVHSSKTNYSLLSHIQKHINRLHVGRLRNHLFRSDLQKERMLLKFEPTKDRLFRQSSHFHIHRFVCGKYCSVKLYESDNGDLMKIELSKPCNLLYRNHQFQGPVISIVFSVEMLHILLARERQLYLMQSAFELERAQFLLSILRFTIDSTSSTTDDVERLESAYSRSEEMKADKDAAQWVELPGFFSHPPYPIATNSLSSTADEGKSLYLNSDKFNQFLELEASKYNAWVDRRHEMKHMKVPFVTVQALKHELFQNLSDPQWHFIETANIIDTMSKVPQFLNALDSSVREERIPVYHGLWTFRSMQSQSMEAKSSALSSFMGNIAIDMNEQKSLLYLTMKESTEAEKSKEFFQDALQSERHQMEKEDSFSQELRVCHDFLANQNKRWNLVLVHHQEVDQTILKRHQQQVETDRKAFLSPFLGFIGSEPIRKRFRSWLQQMFFWKLFAQHFLERLLADNSSYNAIADESLRNQTLLSQLINISQRSSTRDCNLQLFNLQKMNMVKSLQSTVSALFNINPQNDANEDRQWDLSRAFSIFLSKYPIFATLIESYCHSHEFQAHAILQSTVSSSTLPTAKQIRKRSMNGSRFLRLDIFPKPSFPRDLEPIQQFRNSQLWMRNEMLIDKNRDKGKRDAADSGCVLICESSKNKTCVSNTEDCSISSDHDICVLNWKLVSIGVLHLQAFHLSQHQHYEIFFLPTKVTNDHQSANSCHSNSSFHRRGSDAQSQLVHALDTPLKSSAELNYILLTQFSSQFVDLCVLNAMMRVHIHEYESLEKAEMLQLIEQDKENDSEAAHVSLDHESIFVDATEQFHSLHYPSVQQLRQQEHQREDLNENNSTNDEQCCDDYELQSIFSIENIDFNDDNSGVEVAVEGDMTSADADEENNKLSFLDTEGENEMDIWSKQFLGAKLGRKSTRLFFTDLPIQRQQVQEGVNLSNVSYQSRSEEEMQSSLAMTQSGLFNKILRHSNHRKEEIYLFHVPVDEALPVVVKCVGLSAIAPFIASSLQCQDLRGSHLFSETSHILLERVMIYQSYQSIHSHQQDLNIDQLNSKADTVKTGSSGRINPRLQRLLPTLVADAKSTLPSVSDKRGSNSGKDAVIMPPNASMSIERPPIEATSLIRCLGDAVLLVRHSSEKHFVQNLVNAFQQWEQDYRPFLVLRQEKAGKERQWKLLNQQKFATHVHRASQIITPLAEKLFCCHNMNGKEFISPYYARSFSNPPISVHPFFSANIPLNHYYGNNYSLILQFLKLLFRWFDYEKAKISTAPSYWMEILSRADAHLNQRKVCDEKYLQQFDCQIVEFVVPISSNLSGDGEIEDEFEPLAHEQVQTLIDDPYFIFLFRELQHPPNFSSVIEISGSPNSRKFDLPAENQKLLSPIQFFYCLYQHHCTTCAEPISQCRFPHCRHIRTLWTTKLSSLCDDEKNTNTSFTFTDESKEEYLAQEALQEILKEFLATRTSLLTAEQLLNYGIPSVSFTLQTVEEEIFEEDRQDRLALKEYEEKKRLMLSWNLSLTRIRWLEFFQNYILTKELVASWVTPMDILRVKGGLQFFQFQRDYEEVLATFDEVSSTALPFLEIREVNKPKLRRSLVNDRFTRQNSFSAMALKLEIAGAATTAHFLWKYVFPMQVLYDVLPCGHLFDPYPVSAVMDMEKANTKTYPLSSAMFVQLMSQMRFSIRLASISIDRLFSSVHSKDLVRPHPDDSEASLLQAQQANRGVVYKSNDDRVLSFDRLLTEGVITCKDGSLVVAHLLYGTMAEEALSVTENLSIPKAGLRFVPIDSIQSYHNNSNIPHAPTVQIPTKLHRGITLLIYDFASEVSRASYITEREIRKFLEIKERSNESCNYREVANLLLQEQGNILDITRLENYFISVRFCMPLSQTANDDSQFHLSSSFGSLIKSLHEEISGGSYLELYEQSANYSTVDMRNHNRFLISDIISKL